MLPQLTSCQEPVGELPLDTFNEEISARQDCEFCEFGNERGQGGWREGSWQRTYAFGLIRQDHRTDLAATVIVHRSLVGFKQAKCSPFYQTDARGRVTNRQTTAFGHLNRLSAIPGLSRQCIKTGLQLDRPSASSQGTTDNARGILWLLPSHATPGTMTTPHRYGARLSRRNTSSSGSNSGSMYEVAMPSDPSEKAPRYDSPQVLVADKRGGLPNKPLIDYITNEWQTDPKYKEEHTFRPPGRAAAYPESKIDAFLDVLDDFYDAAIDLLRSPTFQRIVFIFVSVVACSLWTWFCVVLPHMQETQAALATFDDINPSKGLYGHNKRPSFPGMIQLRELDPGLLPIDGNSRSHRARSRRLVFVGDIHGCKDELVMLLDKVKFNPKHDHLITTGDMIDKGPDSLGVVDLLRKMNASCVRGNHEDRVLLTRGGLQDMLIAPTSIGEQSKSPREDDAERTLARALSKEQAAYLQSCPVILKVGDISSFRGEVVVVHAGLVPGVPLENQDPSSAMTMRVIDLDSHLPSRDHDRKHSVPWARLWNKVQKLIPNPHSRHGQGVSRLQQQKLMPHMHTTVIYGHDSKRGLQLEQWTKGLDSGCVKGGKLSALVLSDGGKQNLVQVRCHNHVRWNGFELGDAARKHSPGRRDRDD